MILKNIIIIAVLVISLVTIFYLPILNGFFQHDEWQAFVDIYLKNYGGIVDVLNNVFLPKASHYAPFTDLIFNFLFYLFGLNYLGYAIISILMHLLVVLLVFVLTFYLTKKLTIAFIAALFFGLNASTHQATSWIIANINTQGSSLFGILSLIIFLIFLQRGIKRNYLFIISIILLIISLLFKEITIAFVALLPITFLLFAESKMKKYWKVYFFIVLGMGIIYLGFRLFMFTLPVPDSEFVVTKDQNLKEIIYNTLTFPAKIFVQSTIPTWQLLEVSKFTSSLLPDFIAGQPGTTKFDQFVENKALQIIDFSIFILAITTVLFVWKSRTTLLLKKAVLWSFTFTILTSFIYALSPGRNGLIPVVDSRNIYLPALGTSIFITTLAYIIARKRLIIVIFMLTIFIFLHIYWLNQQLGLQTSIGVTRKGILQQIKKEHPNLPKKIVFYVASDTAYYGMSEKIPPFETGLGQALLVWYNPTERFPIKFFNDKFLRFITDQGYREVDGRGFGYFYDRALLDKVIKQNNLSPDSIISYNYFGGTNILQDISIKTRKQLNNENKKISY